MKIYLAGPMRGYAEFNFPAFAKNAQALRALGHEVFSPAEKDIEKHGDKAFKGDVDKQDEVASNAGFSLRKALQMDLDFICAEADGICLMVGWERSKGAVAESSTANALGLRRFVETDLGWMEIESDGRVIMVGSNPRLLDLETVTPVDDTYDPSNHYSHRMRRRG